MEASFLRKLLGKEVRRRRWWAVNKKASVVKKSKGANEGGCGCRVFSITGRSVRNPRCQRALRRGHSPAADQSKPEGLPPVAGSWRGHKAQGGIKKKYCVHEDTIYEEAAPMTIEEGGNMSDHFKGKVLLQELWERFTRGSSRRVGRTEKLHGRNIIT